MLRRSLIAIIPVALVLTADGTGGSPQFTARGGVAASPTPGIVYVSDAQRVVKVGEGARLVLTFDADSDGNVDRTFTVSGPGATQTLLTDDDTDPVLSNTVVATALAPGTWHVDLTNAPTNVKTITCSNGVHTVDFAAHAVDIALAPGQTISCSFYAEWIG